MMKINWQTNELSRDVKSCQEKFNFNSAAKKAPMDGIGYTTSFLSTVGHAHASSPA